MSEVVSNYPRGEELVELTPDLAQSAMAHASLNQGWTILPQMGWVAFLFFSVTKIYSHEWMTYGSRIGIVLGVVFGIYGLVSIQMYSRKLKIGRLRVIASYFLWLWGYLPMIGPLGPIVLQHWLCKDMRRFGIPSKFNNIDSKCLREISVHGQKVTPLG